jgi:hypothetical protein
MKTPFPLLLTCLAFLFSSPAQPTLAKFSERFKNDQHFENLQQFLPPKIMPQHKNGDWYEPDTVYVYNPDGSPTERYCFSYENGKCMFYIIQSWRYGSWNNNAKYLYTYNAQNNIQQIIIQLYEFEQWVDFITLVYTYNEQNNLAEIMSRISLDYWDNYNKIIYTYDAQSNIAEELLQEWHYSQWENSEKYSYLYDAQNNMTDQLLEQWKAGQWVNDSKRTYSYNVQNNLTEELVQWWQAGQWENAGIYINTTDNSIQENRKESAIKIYPNPTTGELIIEITDQARNDVHSIDIFDVYGRKLSSNHLIATSSHHLINISSLPPGIYIVKIDGVCQKVVKQ